MAKPETTPREPHHLAAEYGPPNPSEQEMKEATRRKNLRVALYSGDYQDMKKAADELAKDLLQKLRPDGKYHL